MSTAAGASLLAHGLHATMLLLGLWGLAALAVPHVLGRGRSVPLRDGHDLRVAELRSALAHGRPGVALAPDPVVVPERPAAQLALPLAVVASLAAAGIHAAVAPPHLREGLLFGGFFIACALAQLCWAWLALHPSSQVLMAGIALNAGVLALWLTTRTVGLPWGLLPRPEAVGDWDVACAGWEVAVVVACARLLRTGAPRSCPDWFEWHPAARFAVGLGGVSLALLTLLGGHA